MTQNVVQVREGDVMLSIPFKVRGAGLRPPIITHCCTHSICPSVLLFPKDYLTLHSPGHP